MHDFLIVGIDVSKASLDICFKPVEIFIRIENNAGGFKTWYKELMKYCSAQTKLLVVLEHTGRYSLKIEAFMRSKEIAFCKVPALQIKRSLGVMRGKNDKIDSSRIAEYGWLRREILIPDPMVDQKIEDLRSLMSLRSKLVRDRAGYIARVKEIISTGGSLMDFEIKIQNQIINILTSKICVIEGKMKGLIKSNDDLSKTSELLQGIKGVGWIVACYMIITTANFKKFANARKFNCYAGLAPFKHESGTSIRGKSRVSHLANKEVKSLLNLAAFCAIQHDPEMKSYYQRRVSEGKGKMSCMNIIRSKIVARMFAVIKRQTPYQLVAA